MLDNSTAQTVTSLLTVELLPSNRAPYWLPAATSTPGTALTCTPVAQSTKFPCQDLSSLVADLDIALGVGEALTFAITAGNTGGAFSINPATGQVTVEASINFPSAFNLTITSEGQGHQWPCHVCPELPQ